ncbi:hypothetical protein D0962_35805 [Leptolyngbyaceae cyanobacterium CCMR0082]|uniref:Uncharacterized protein n=1 Tax=Adonisia turfae CCMR0082 TaxID=2304604 RepID=A0A6M0SHK7_9CYAN|nr:hypothetical protein [Adonisia turfae]NEZ68038.1 hypothetical protein [Adonisia turfae CCMR0082]
MADLCSVADTSIIDNASFNSLGLAEQLEIKRLDAASLAEQGFNSITAWLTIDQAPEMGVYSVSSVSFGKFLELVHQLKSPFIEFHTMEQFSAIAENVRLAISLIKLAESGRPQMSVIQGGLKGVSEDGGSQAGRY